jgi:hypothetical protein
VNRLRKLLSLSPTDRWLLLQAGALLAAATLAAAVLPFPRMRRLQDLVIAAADRAKSSGQADEAAIIRAVTRASRCVPGAHCLPRSLAAQVLLAHYGYPTQLWIGATRSPAGELFAHAWLERHGRVVIGAVEGLSRYTRIPPLALERASRGERL